MQEECFWCCHVHLFWLILIMCGDRVILFFWYDVILAVNHQMHKHSQQHAPVKGTDIGSTVGSLLLVQAYLRPIG